MQQEHLLRPDNFINQADVVSTGLDVVSLKAPLTTTLPPLREKPTWQVCVVSSRVHLEQLAKRLAGERDFSLDTETYGLKGEPINERLAWVQIGLPKRNARGAAVGQGEIFLVDALELTREAEEASHRSKITVNPLEPLRSVLQDGKITKIIQHAQFELDQFDKFKIHLKGVVDTEKLAKRLRPRLASYALGALAVEVLGYSIDKGEQTSDWSQRPLSDSQKNYAAMDAQVTYEVFHRLRELEHRAGVGRKISLQDAIARIVQLTAERQKLLRGVANEAAVLALRIKRQRAELSKLMLQQYERSGRRAGFVDPGLGSVTYRFGARPDLQAIRSLFPGEANELIQETASKRAIRSCLRYAGLSSYKIGKIIKQVFEPIGYARSTLRITPNYEVMYERQNAGLRKFKSTWKEQKVVSPQDLNVLRDALRGCTTVWLSAQKPPIRNGLPRVEIGAAPPEKSPGGGRVFILGPELAQQHPAEFADFLESLPGQLQRPGLSLLLHNRSETSRALRNLSIDLREAIDLRALARTVRPDLVCHSLKACTVEILGEDPCAMDGAVKSEAALRLYTRLSAMEQEAASPLEAQQICMRSVNGVESQDEKWRVADEAARSLLQGIVRDTAVRLALLRETAEQSDTLSTGIAELKNSIRAKLQKRCTKPGETCRTREAEEKFGRAMLIPRAVSRLDLDKLKREYPQIAKRVVHLAVNRRKMDRLLEGLDVEARRQIQRQVYVPDLKRLPMVKIRPRFKLLYCAASTAA